MSDFGFLAYLALAGVVITSLALFFLKKPEEACLTIIMAAILFLPERVAFKLPKVPPLDRESLPYLCLLIFIAIRRKSWIRQARVGRGVDLLVFISAVAAIATAWLNPDPLSYGKWGPGTHLQGLDLNDGLALAGDDLLLMGVPFVLGRLLVRDVQQTRRLLLAFAVGGLIYSLFILVELRLSPQMHRWVYGYTARANSFGQAMRGGGYRPIVFMTHPLAVAMFMCNAVLAAFILVRDKRRLFGVRWQPFAVYLLLVLIACKCMAAVVYAVVGSLLISFTKPRTQLRVGVAIAALIVAYPALRANNLFPVQTILSVANLASADREGSLGFRFENEDQLLAKVRQRPVFGWGGYGRSMVYEPDYGNFVSIVDGFWIISLGVRGAVGALCKFALLLLPIWNALRNFRRIPGKQEQVLIGGTVVILMFSALDLLPNGLFLNYPYFLAGGLFGMTRAFALPPGAVAPSARDWERGDVVEAPGLQGT
jgi:hypothetical protein